MDFNLDATYGNNNDKHKSKIIKYKPNNLATMMESGMTSKKEYLIFERLYSEKD